MSENDKTIGLGIQTESIVELRYIYIYAQQINIVHHTYYIFFFLIVQPEWVEGALYLNDEDLILFVKMDVNLKREFRLLKRFLGYLHVSQFLKSIGRVRDKLSHKDLQKSLAI